MEAMRQSWSDDRLDDLSNRVETGFAHVDARFDASSTREDARFARLEGQIDEAVARLDSKIDTKVDVSGGEVRRELGDHRFRNSPRAGHRLR